MLKRRYVMQNRRLFLSILVLTLVAVIIGCAPSAPATTTPATSTPVVQTETIRIGILGPMKFRSGEDQWKGALLAAEEINAAGGFKAHGKTYKLELTKVDDNCLVSTPDAAAAIEKAATVDKFPIVIAGGRTEAVMAQQEIAMDHKMMYLGISQTNTPNLRIVKDYNRYKYYFNNGICFVTPLYGYWATSSVIPALNAINKAIKPDKVKVALIGEKNAYGDQVLGLVKSLLPKIGCEVVGEWRPSHLATDMSAELTQIKAADPHLIFPLFSVEGGVAFTRQYGELKIPAAVAGNNSQAQDGQYWTKTNGLCNYETTTDGTADVDMTTLTKPFYKNFQDKYGNPPAWSGPGSYDGILMIVDGIKRSASMDPDDLVKGFEQVSVLGAEGTCAWVSKDDPARPHAIKYGKGYFTGVCKQWVDGKQVVVFPDGEEIPQAFQDAGMGSFKGLRYGGTQDFTLPPWMLEHWKK
jgi:branched-chain amino acid transport system substrate-binding protein